MNPATMLVLLLLATPGGADSGPAVTEAMRVDTAFGSVFVTTAVPDGHYAERHDGEAYWLPGIDEGTSLVRKVIRSARSRRDSATRVELLRYEAGSRRVFVTPDPPFPGVFWMRVGDRHAWIPGVEKPLEADMTALEATSAQLEAELPAVASARR